MINISPDILLLLFLCEPPAVPTCAFLSPLPGEVGSCANPSCCRVVPLWFLLSSSNISAKRHEMKLVLYSGFYWTLCSSCLHLHCVHSSVASCFILKGIPLCCHLCCYFLDRLESTCAWPLLITFTDMFTFHHPAAPLLWFPVHFQSIFSSSPVCDPES